MADGRYEAVPTNAGIVQLNDGTYDLFRAIIEKILPAAGVFYALVGSYLKWGNVIEVTGILAGAAVFLGVVLSLARRGYSPAPAKSVTDAPTSFDGEIALSGVAEDGTPIAQIQLTDDAKMNFLTKPVLTIKGFDENA